MEHEEISKMEEITEIYKEQTKDTMMGPNTQTRTRRILKVFALVALLLSLAGWLIYFILLNVDSPPSGSLVFELSAPDKAIPGATITYNVHLRNEDKATIQSARVRLNYPDGFVYRGASVEPEEGPSNTWLIEEIKPNETFDLEIQGALLGDSNAPRILFGITNYQLEGFKSRLELSDSVTTFLGEEIVSVEIVGSETVIAGDTISLGVVVQNLGDEELSDLELKMTLADNVTIKTTEPTTNTNGGDIVWPIDKLEPGEKESYSLQVGWSNEVTGDTDISATLQGTSLSGVKYSLGRDNLKVQFEKPEVTTQLEINSIVTNEAVLDGRDLVIVMKATNNSEEAIPVSGFQLTINKDVIDWSQANLVNVNRSNNTLLWSFNELAPIETKTITWVMPISDSVPADTLVEFNFELVP